MRPSRLDRPGAADHDDRDNRAPSSRAPEDTLTPIAGMVGSLEVAPGNVVLSKLQSLPVMQAMELAVRWENVADESP